MSEDGTAQQLDQRDGWDDADSALLGLELTKSDDSVPEIDQDLDGGGKQQAGGSCTPPSELAEAGDLSGASAGLSASYNSKASDRVPHHCHLHVTTI